MEHVVTQHADPATQHEPVTPPSRGLLAAVGGLVGGVVTVGVAEFLAGVFLRLGWSDGTPSPVLAVGGVGPADMAAWRAAGALGFGLGSELYRIGQTPAETADKAARVVATMRALD